MQSCDIDNSSEYEQYEALFVVMEEALPCRCLWCWKASDDFEIQISKNNIRFQQHFLINTQY